MNVVDDLEPATKKQRINNHKEESSESDNNYSSDYFTDYIMSLDNTSSQQKRPYHECTAAHACSAINPVPDKRQKLEEFLTALLATIESHQ